MNATPEHFEPVTTRTTLVCRLVGGPFDGDEILMAPGEYSLGPPQLLAQPESHPQHGIVFACYEAERGFCDWPNEPADRVVCRFQFEGWRNMLPDYCSPEITS